MPPIRDRARSCGAPSRSVTSVAKSEEFGAPVEFVVELPGGGRRSVPITNPDKVMFPSVIAANGGKEERTKLDLARYYVAVGEPIMRTLQDRAVLLERYPNGVRGTSFFQKRIPASAPDWLWLIPPAVPS